MQNGAHHKINANVTQNKVKENGLANNMRNITSEYQVLINVEAVTKAAKLLPNVQKLRFFMYYTTVSVANESNILYSLSKFLPKWVLV